MNRPSLYGLAVVPDLTLAPVMPPPVRPGLPDDVVAILIVQHSNHVALLRIWERAGPASAYPGFIEGEQRRARDIRRALYASGHAKEADALGAEAWGIAPVPDGEAPPCPP